MAGDALEIRDRGARQHFAELLDGGECERAFAILDTTERVVAQAAVQDGRDVKQADTGLYRTKIKVPEGERSLD